MGCTRSARKAALAAIMLIQLPQAVPGQVRRDLRVERCDACSVRISYVATLAGHDSIGGISPTPTLIQLPSGEYVASNWFDLGGLLVFDSRGRPTRTIGRRGAGPGEFHTVHAIRERNGSIHVYDRGNSRITVLDEMGRILNEMTVDVPLHTFLPLGNGGYLAGAELHSPETVGFPLHFITPSGNLGKSFGDDTGAYGPGLGGVRMYRILNVANDGSIWSARRGRYTLERWDKDGILTHQFDRSATWFPVADPTSRISLEPESPPQTLIVDFDFDDSGLLWILIAYPSNDWRTYVQKIDREFPNEIAVYKVTRPDKIRTTVLELIDPVSGGVLFTRRYSPMFLGFIGDGRVYSYQEDEAGVGRYHIWQFTISGF